MREGGGNQTDATLTASGVKKMAKKRRRKRKITGDNPGGNPDDKSGRQRTGAKMSQASKKVKV